MICEKILGKLENMNIQGKTLEYVDVEWHEAFKKIHRKTTNTGREVGIRLGDSVLKTGLLEGDVLYADQELIIAVRTPPCAVLKARVSPHHPEMIPKVCYEIGNRHAPFHGVEVERAVEALNFQGQISSQVGHSHHHGASPEEVGHS